jgi:hypothetical protein
MRAPVILKPRTRTSTARLSDATARGIAAMIVTTKVVITTLRLAGDSLVSSERTHSILKTVISSLRRAEDKLLTSERTHLALPGASVRKIARLSRRISEPTTIMAV